MSLYGINSYLSNSYYSSLLSNNFKKNNNSSNSLSDLSELMKKADQVRSRSYQKSMIEEYRKVFSGSDDSVGSLESEEALSKDAKNLSNSASALATADNSFYADKEKVAEGVQSFVDNYNSTIESLKKSDSVNALKKGLSMTNTTKAYAKTLARIGISVGSDNLLSLDKEKLSEAPDTTVKSLFSGHYSLANKTADKASDVSRAASLKAQITYNSSGNLDYFTKLSMNSMFSEKI